MNKILIDLLVSYLILSEKSRHFQPRAESQRTTEAVHRKNCF